MSKYVVTNIRNGGTRFLNGSDLLVDSCPHITVKEWSCNDGSRIVLFDPEAVKMFQKIRDFYGIPLSPSSAYRTPEYNDIKAVGGGSESYHMQGMAFDLHTPSTTAFSFFCLNVREMLPKTKIIRYEGWGGGKGGIHVDTRNIAIDEDIDVEGELQTALSKLDEIRECIEEFQEFGV